MPIEKCKVFITNKTERTSLPNFGDNREVIILTEGKIDYQKALSLSEDINKQLENFSFYTPDILYICGSPLVIALAIECLTKRSLWESQEIDTISKFVVAHYDRQADTLHQWQLGF